ncbi:hypothetical protein [Undibacterium sp. TJN19]|uniref:hypothetical protein n=1 Tax=Undibacterium sp. TJN19 TaxID=3413055 RepID=UPI003BF32DAC
MHLKKFALISTLLLSLAPFALHAQEAKEVKETADTKESKEAEEPKAQEVKAPKELVLNKQQLEGYSKSYKTPEVACLRKFLNTYADARKKISPAEEKAAAVLDGMKIDKTVLKGKFMVYQYANIIGGGKGVSIVSQDHPEVILDFWVYKIDDKACEVRDLLVQPDNRNIENFKIMYRNYLHHKTLFM